MKLQLQKAIAEILRCKPSDIHLEHPGNESYGDYSTNVEMKSDNPSRLATKIKKELEKKNLPFIKKITIINAFINITINNKWLSSQIEKVLTEKECYGTLAGSEKKIMVEFAHPNTHKLFHIGHLRNISTGESIVRILGANGYKIIRANYQGDVGLHIAKCLYGILQSKKEKVKSKKIEFLGKCYVAGNKAYEEDEKAKKEIIAINKKIYDKADSEINKLWQETRQWSLEYFEEIYKRVYSHFDRYYFESQVYEKGREIALEALKKGILVKSKGAVIFPGKKYGLHDRVFINSEGNPTYEAKDLQLAKLQFGEYQPDLIIHVVAKEQTGYFKVLFKALEMILPSTVGKEFHLDYGWVNLKKGKMSSREGNVVLGQWLLDEVKDRIGKIMDKVIKGGKVTDRQETVEALAVAAVKYSFLKQGVYKDIAFDIDESVSLEGNSGPYLLYTYARCKSVIEKSKVNPASAGQNSKVQIKNQNDFPNIEELAILRTIYKFPEVVLEAGKSYSPSNICTFLYDLAGKYNTFYNKHRILKSNFRLALTAATAQVLKNGLNLLGIKTVEKM